MKAQCGPLIKNIMDLHNGGGISVSIEISPSGSEEETCRILRRIDHVHSRCPLQFCAVTWHMRTFPNSYGMNAEALQMARKLRIRNKNVLLHVAAKGLSKESMLQILHNAHSFNVENIFALRGDDLQNTLQDFPHAEDLVKFIRLHASEQTVICVAGYPKGHPEASSYNEDLLYLKEKVNAGANFIITQIILDADEFNTFVKDCRMLGICVPILAGIMPIQEYSSFQRISKLCHLQIPQHIQNILETIKDNPESVKSFGIYHAVMLAKAVLSAGNSTGLHFFTLNRIPALLEILEHTGLAAPSPSKSLRIPLDVNATSQLNNSEVVTDTLSVTLSRK